MIYTVRLAIQVALGGAMMGSIVYFTLCVIGSRKWLRDCESFSSKEDFSPPVSILKPLRGEDPLQYENFQSFLSQDYPSYQLVFGAMDSEDKGLDTARRLLDENPGSDISIVSGAAPIGMNYKICSLIEMMKFTRHDLLVLADSDMHVESDYLRRIIAPFKSPKVGLVTCLYRGYHPQGIASILEGMGIGASFAPSVFAAYLLEGISFAFGSTIVIRRDVLEEIGGLECIVNALADDYLLGNKVKKAGYDVALSDYVVDDALGRESFADMWGRRLRWARTMKAMRTVGWAGSGITHGVPLAILFLIVNGFHSLGWTVALLMLLYRYLTAFYVATNATSDYNIIRYWYMLPISDCLDFSLWIASFLGNTVEWRGIRMNVTPGGELTNQGKSARGRSWR